MTSQCSDITLTYKDVRLMFEENNQKLSQKLLKLIFDYDEHSGVLSRKVNFPGQKRNDFVGAKAESRRTKGYAALNTSVFGQKHKVHRLIWLLKMGEWPHEIDHINGDATDNRWCNLREVSRAGNCKNARKRSDNTTGLTGVIKINPCPSRPYSGWASVIHDDNKRVNLYCGNDFFEACCRRKSAELRYGFHENHGRA